MSFDNNLIKELHFYSEKKETIIKDIIWITAASGGIIVPFFFDSNASMGAAYFLFSLSLLVEFVPKISNVDSLGGRLFRGTFCAFQIVIFIFSIIMILGKTNLFSYFLLVLCIFIIFFLILDMGIALFAPNNKFEDQPSESNTVNATPMEIKIFLENLKKGSLGEVEGDDGDEC